MGDASQNLNKSNNTNTITNLFSLAKKRRTEHGHGSREDENEQSRLPSSAPASTLLPAITLSELEMSDRSDLETDSDREEVPLSDTTSTDTVVSAHRIKTEKEKLALKLDRLNDKKCRFESHEAFLNKCIDNNIVPNGLKVYVEPSIGNRD